MRVVLIGAIEYRTKRNTSIPRLAMALMGAGRNLGRNVSSVGVVLSRRGPEVARIAKPLSSNSFSHPLSV